MEKEDTNRRLPTLHVVADSIPRAFYRAMKAVWENGLRIRTEYDRKDSKGNYIDPESRDARVLIEVTNPLQEPRFPAISFSERGKYLAEMMGVKNNLILSLDELRRKIERKENLEATEWPYHYSQRLREYPLQDGRTLDQIDIALKRVAKTPYTRRAVASTPLPEIDTLMKEDLPCLREIQLRCVEGDDETLYLNVTTTWRSRDLYKAWADNVIGVTFWQKLWADELSEMMGRKVGVGSYADFSMSLHIYGQDFRAVEGDKEEGLKSFFERHDEEEFVRKSMRSEDARDLLIIPELEDLLREKEMWRIEGRREETLKWLIEKFKSGYLP